MRATAASTLSECGFTPQDQAPVGVKFSVAGILKPGKTYVMWFNRGQYNSFRDTGNQPAVPYQLVFKTKDK